MNLPQTKEDWVRLGGKILWLFSRLQILGLIVGACGALILQLMTGFWEFRDQHQDTIRKRYELAVEANTRFERQLADFNLVFDGRSVADRQENYAVAAQTYITTLKSVTYLLPGTSDNLNRYVDRLSVLNIYYGVANPPKKGSEEWMTFYGNFRLDYDRYTKAKEAYFDSLASQLGDYKRYIVNS